MRAKIPVRSVDEVRNRSVNLVAPQWADRRHGVTVRERSHPAHLPKVERIESNHERADAPLLQGSECGNNLAFVAGSENVQPLPDGARSHFGILAFRFAERSVRVDQDGHGRIVAYQRAKQFQPLGCERAANAG